MAAVRASFLGLAAAPSSPVAGARRRGVPDRREDVLAAPPSKC